MRRWMTALGLCVLTAAAGAQRGGGDRWEFFEERYDGDSDGAITLKEYGRDEKTFKRLDTNGDGKLTSADFASGRRRGRGGRDPKRMRARLFERVIDTDENGEVSAGEWKAFLGALPKKGVVDARDFAAAGVPRRMARMVPPMFDVDGDGSATRAEVEKVFGELDRNRDGKLAAGEISGGALPRVGDVAPDFDLPTLANVKKTVKLSSFAGKRPVALIFGSYT